MRTKLEFIQSGADVSRYHTVTTLCSETVGHHSHGVAMLCLLIDPMASRDLLIAALSHDLAEHVTGDIPSPAKRLYGIGEQVSVIENEVLSTAGFGLPKLSEHESRVLKLADLAHGALFCAKELKLGNTRILHIFERYLSYAWVYLESECVDGMVGAADTLFLAIEEMVK